jgi:SAM-dependent MidA family methyltransferase
MTFATQFPEPTVAALDSSRELAAHIREHIERAGGWIDFARYMELALYTPGLGYYSAGSTKLGPGGDFVTAPEIGDFLGRALAAQLAPELARHDAPMILELGAGTGSLASQVLLALEALGERRVQYRILEPSADLRARQQQALRAFGSRVGWLDALPSAPFEGAVLANEVLDALPVTRFVKRAGGVLPVGVTVRHNDFAWAEGFAEPRLSAAVAAIEDDLGEPLAEGYCSEISGALPAWLKSVSTTLERGVLLLCDYGLVRREYYHPERSAGTLICHYRHRAHTNPFAHPGLQDITAWVDFSACARAADDAGLRVAGFTTQAQFLLTTLPVPPPPLAVNSSSAREIAALKTMVLPGEMGERFKILMLEKTGSGQKLPGRDLRDRL